MPGRLFSPRSQVAADGRLPGGEPADELTRRQIWPEAVAFLLLTFSVYLVLALASLGADPHDPAIHGEDWVGPVGAAMAGFLARGFGAVAWLVPLELIALGFPLLRGRRPQVTGLRIAGNVVLAIVLAALAHVVFPDARVFGNLSTGGHVGLLFGELFEALFSTAGSLLVGFMIVGLILISRASFSFIELCQRIAVTGRIVFDWAMRLFHRFWGAWTKAHRLRLAETPKSPAQTKPPLRPTDEAIVAELGQHDDEWVPLEKTGVPPLAIADSLKSAWSELIAAEAQASPPPATEPDSDASRPEVQRSGAEAVVPVKEIELPDKMNGGAAPTSPVKKSAPEDAPQAVQPGGSDASKGSTSIPQSDPGELKIVDTSHNTEVVREKRLSRPKPVGFCLPDTDLLDLPSREVVQVDKDRVLELADRLVKTLGDYRVVGQVEEVHPGPTVTTYEFSPEAGTKVSKVASLCDDLALGLSRKVRIIAPIPGKSRIGFELPNDERVPVNLRELIEDKRFEKLSKKSPLPVVLGRDIVGSPFYADLASMPHVIVAGATGAGKSVGLNVMLSSLLFQRSPEDLRLLMIDPKVVELAPFDGIPHMLLPVVTDMKQATKALKWAVDEMEKRYKAFAVAGTKNITTYNHWVERVHRGEAEPKPQDVEALTADGSAVTVPAAQSGSDGLQLPGRMPHIVIVVDEFADLMMQQGKDVEAAVARLAQKARAAGMHVVLATQRPSVDVITGMIKANFPTRIAYRVAQKVDSRTILDEMGAELLLGRGDMLVKLNGSTETHRVQCPFISEEEVSALCDHLRSQGAPVYHDDILRADDDEEGSADADENLDSRYDEAVRIVAETQRCSTSWLQRKMTIGYNRAAKIVEAMEARGVVGPPNGSKEREIFVHPQ